MYRLIPGFIQEQYTKETFRGSFEACALFVGVSDFTAITDGRMGHGQHGAEILANIIQEVFDPLVKRVFE